jgi:hypothetical protein
LTEKQVCELAFNQADQEGLYLRFGQEPFSKSPDCVNNRVGGSGLNGTPDILYRAIKAWDLRDSLLTKLLKIEQSQGV